MRKFLSALLLVGALFASTSCEAALALDGSVHKNISSGPTTVTLTTANANDVIVVFVGSNSGSGSGATLISSITSSHVTFTRRAGVAVASTPSNGIEEWRGVATGALSSEVITISYSATISFSTIDAFGISGADTSTIYDSNGSLPATSTTGLLSVSTSNAADIIIGAYRTGTATLTAGAGYTPIGTTNFQLSEYQIVAVTQSGLSITIGTGSGTQNGGIGDAIMQASGGGGGATCGQLALSGVGC